ncbi:MAG: hypothetical protein JNK37_19515 [Verrucomicrobiales bacterium]|nr:hypothetical protein [Verrucomicrobiales bacterium]
MNLRLSSPSPFPRTAGRWPGLLILLALVALLSPTAARAQSANAVTEDTARLLAGLPIRGGSGLEAVAASAEARNHAAAMEELWTRWEQIRLGKMRNWAALQVRPQIRRPKTLFYLFGGPDLVSAATLFPGVELYTLGGLEPVGQIPDLRTMSPEALAQSLAQVRHNLRSIQEKGFFETREMRTDLAQGSVSGVWPILALFAVRTGHEVTEWSRIGLDRDGRVIAGGATGGGPQGVQLTLRSADPAAGTQTVHYFSADVSDAGLGRDGRYLAYLSDQSPGGTYLKAASYLMHEDSFSRIRGFLLERSVFILQDASGIPAARFETGDWDIRTYGRYAGPVDIFKEYEQPGLYGWFQPPRWRGPLPFGANYRYSDEDAHQIFLIRQRWPDEAPAAGTPLRAVPTVP